jgi:ParB-like nuclease domain
VPAGLEQRGSPPAHATGAVQFVAMDEIAADETFRLRPDGDISQLAAALGRLGQLSPVELRPWPGSGSDGPRWQVVSGFRRLAAARWLARERVLARLHHELGEEDAWGLALGEALLHQPLTGGELEALRERLRASGVAPWAEELVDEALVRAPVAAELRERFYDFLRGPKPEPGADSALAPVPEIRDSARPVETKGETAPEEEYIEVTPEELVQDVAGRLSALIQDLATAVEAWKDLPEEGRKVLVDQARYVASLLPFMEARE